MQGVKLLDENIGETLHDIIGNDLLNQDPKTQEIRA